MAHNEYNKPKKSGAYFLIIFGALIFMIAPGIFSDRPEIGLAAIAAGFGIGGLGFYLRFVRK